MNRSRAKAGKALRRACAAGLIAALARALPAPALAGDAPLELWLAGTRLILEDPQRRQGELAVDTSDSGFARFLGVAGAAVAYQPGQGYIVVTTADRRTINFTLGDAQFTVNGVTQVAPFAPYVAGRSVYLPFLALAKALYFDALQDGTTTVLEPQLGALDVRPQGRTTLLTLRAGTQLRYKRLSGANEEHVALEFDGLGSTLEATRTLGVGGVRGVAIDVHGGVKNPVTVVDIDVAPGTAHALVPGDSRNTLALAFAPAGVALGGVPLPETSRALPVAALPYAAPAAPPPPPLPPPVAPSTAPLAAAPQPSAAFPAPLPASAVPAQITGFKTSAGAGDGVNVDVALTGNVSYEWHRLADNRWYVDLKPATLTIPSQDVPLRYSAMPAMRLKSFTGPHDNLPTVRIALSLDAPRAVALAQSAGGLRLSVGADDDATLARAGYGQLVDGALASAAAPPAPGGVALGPLASAPQTDLTPAPEATWKFGPAAPYNARLIVLDPGHGGSDTGAMHNALVEKDLNLAVSKRLRDLLVSRGWVVKMTRDTDVDVYEPNDSARDELQARCDLANAAGARLFISIHTNSFTSSYQHGTTTYYYQAQAYALAQAVHARLAATLPTADDGILKANFYVIHHTKMPSILVETAFLSNPTDAAWLHSNAFLQKVALGIADGVGDYAQSPAQPVSATAPDDASGDR